MAGIGDLVGMMRNLGGLQAKVQAAQDELARQTAEGSAGGGMVIAKVNGRLDLVDLVIEPEMAGDDVELLQDMVKAAVCQAMDKARDLQRQEFSKLLGGMPLPPGLESILGQ